MNIVILGGDGYLGWPLSLRLAQGGHRVLIIDNLLRRKLVASCGATLLDLPTPQERIDFANKRLGCDISFLEADASEADLGAVFSSFKPDLIYNLAQQPSAPYSMSSRMAALQTIRNNELSNMNIIWSVRDYDPRIPVVKMASFGAYANCGIDIECGYFKPEINKKKVSQPILFPMSADDIYHTTKINDVQMNSMACREWGMNIVEVMQSTIFGVCEEGLSGENALYTRYDYDAMFGTVLNRFILQAVSGLPISVYGTGHQRTGLMSLGAAVRSLSSLTTSPSPSGHRFINHVTISDMSVLEIAQSVQASARKMGIQAEISVGSENPRAENVQRKQTYGVQSSIARKESIEAFFPEIANHILKRSAFIDPNMLVPNVSWGTPQTAKPVEPARPVRPHRPTAGFEGLQVVGGLA